MGVGGGNTLALPAPSLCLPSSRDSFVMPTPAGCLSVLLLLLSGVLAGPREFCCLVWWGFGDFGSPALTRRGWQKVARLMHLLLLVAGCHIVSLSSRLESRWQGSMNT